jgi:pyruvate formate lyase activating enzyme
MGHRVLTRRAFIGAAARAGIALGGAGALASMPLGGTLARWLDGAARVADGTPLADLLRTAPAARYWASTEQPGVACSSCHEAADLARRGVPPPGPGTRYRHETAAVKCLLCARGCVLREGARGECGARMNRGGELRSLVYGRPVAVHVDPIEKKPFFHFLPGSSAFSLATAGCPLHCQFCQNWEISQSHPEDHAAPFVGPEQLAAVAADRRVPVVAFTYNEPTVFTEYLTDVARAGRLRGLRSVIVSCGFMTEAPLAEMCQVLDAFKVDLKGFNPEFYRKVTGAELQPVLRSILQIAHSRRHLELVNLVVPTLNDGDAMLRGLVDWVAGELGPDVPLHFTRFHPDYRLLNLPPTPVETLERARALAMEKGLHYVYVGNVPGHAGNHTYCPGCGKAVVERDGLFLEAMHLRGGACAFCGRRIAGVWS